MPRTALLVVAALATAAVLVPTGAVPFDTTGSDSVTGELVLRPADGPNGDYAVLNEDDEIELLLTGANPSVDGDGVNADSVTPLPRVFTITYTGEGSAEVWLTDDADDVRFYRGGDSDDTLEGREHSVVLSGEESIAVGLRVDTRGDHDVADAGSFTIHGEAVDDATGESDGDEPSGGDGTNGDRTGPDGDSGDDSSETNDDDSSSSPGVDGTPEPTEEDTGSVAGEGTEMPNEQGDDTGPQTAETATSEETVTTTQPTDETGSTGGVESNDGGPVEIGGVVLGPLLAIVGGLAGLLCLLVGIRLYE